MVIGIVLQALDPEKVVPAILIWRKARKDLQVVASNQNEDRCRVATRCIANFVRQAIRGFTSSPPPPKNDVRKSGWRTSIA